MDMVVMQVRRVLVGVRRRLVPVNVRVLPDKRWAVLMVMMSVTEFRSV